MSFKISSLKDWLTVEDAAEQISAIRGEEVKAERLLELASQRRLTLSINLDSDYPAVPGKRVDINDAILYRASFNQGKSSCSADSEAGKRNKVSSQEEWSIRPATKEEKKDFLEAYLSVVAESGATIEQIPPSDRILKRRATGVKANSQEAGVVYYFDGAELPDRSGVLKFDRDKINRITGLWDLAILKDEELKVADMYRVEKSDADFDLRRMLGTILKHPTKNIWATLYHRISDEHDGMDIRDFQPSRELPKNAPIVLRRDEFQRSVDLLNEEAAQISCRYVGAQSGESYSKTGDEVPVTKPLKMGQTRMLNSEINEAKSKATDPNDYHAVWTVLKEMAICESPPFSGRIDPKMGLEFTNDKEEKAFFSKNALRNRMRRSAQ